MGRFTGKSVVVTGAAQGIGLAIVTAFLDEGASVVAFDSNTGPGPVRRHRPGGPRYPGERRRPGRRRYPARRTGRAQPRARAPVPQDHPAWPVRPAVRRREMRAIPRL